MTLIPMPTGPPADPLKSPRLMERRQEQEGPRRIILKNTAASEDVAKIVETSPYAVNAGNVINVPLIVRGRAVTTRPYEVNAVAQTLRLLLEKYVRLIADEANWDEECLPPTPRAEARMCHLLVEAFVLLPVALHLANGAVFPDGEGGVRLEWRSPGRERYVALHLHPSDAREDYLYYQQGSLRGDLFAQVTAGQLAERLLWLSGPQK